MPTTHAPGGRGRSKRTPTNPTSATHVSNQSDRAHQSTGPPDAESQLQTTALSVGHRLLAPPAADPLDARGDSARRGLQRLEHATDGGRASPADAGVPLLHAV